MIGFVRRNVVALGIAGTLALAAVSGFSVATALGVGTQGPPSKTVTIDVGTGTQGPAGPQGPPGPPGPKGDPGAESCPIGSTFTAVVVNAPKGQTTLWTCVKD